jgi:hypothetical protein
MLGAAVIVLDADDTVFAEIAAGRRLDHCEIVLGMFLFAARSSAVGIDVSVKGE